jgi:hypothetical protein
VASSQAAEGPFGDDDDIAPNRIRRGYCNRLFRLATNLDQSTTKTKEVKKMAKSDWLASLIAFLVLGYLALAAAGAFAFTFVW